MKIQNVVSKNVHPKICLLGGEDVNGDVRTEDDGHISSKERTIELVSAYPVSFGLKSKVDHDITRACDRKKSFPKFSKMRFRQMNSEHLSRGRLVDILSV